MNKFYEENAPIYLKNFDFMNSVIYTCDILAIYLKFIWYIRDVCIYRVSQKGWDT